jgi:hypothetical protein
MEIATRSSIPQFLDCAAKLAETDVSLLTTPVYSDIAKVTAGILTFQQATFEFRSHWDRVVTEFYTTQKPLPAEVLNLAERCARVMLSIYGERRFTDLAVKSTRQAEVVLREVQDLRSTPAFAVVEPSPHVEAEAAASPEEPTAQAADLEEPKASPGWFGAITDYMLHRSVTSKVVRAVASGAVSGADYMVNRSYTAAGLGAIKRMLISPSREEHDAETEALIAAVAAQASNPAAASADTEE